MTPAQSHIVRQGLTRSKVRKCLFKGFARGVLYGDCLFEKYQATEKTLGSMPNIGIDIYGTQKKWGLIFCFGEIDLIYCEDFF